MDIATQNCSSLLVILRSSCVSRDTRLVEGIGSSQMGQNIRRTLQYANCRSEFQLVSLAEGEESQLLRYLTVNE